MVYHLHPVRLTWNLRIHPWKRKIIFQTIIFRFYVNLRGCISYFSPCKKRAQKGCHLSHQSVWCQVSLCPSALRSPTSSTQNLASTSRVNQLEKKTQPVFFFNIGNQHRLEPRHFCFEREMLVNLYRSYDFEEISGMRNLWKQSAIGCWWLYKLTWNKSSSRECWINLATCSVYHQPT